MSPDMQSELDIANEALCLLRDLGEVSLVYLTAEFAPFSNQKRPDICFVPKQGRKAGEVFVTEFKLLPGRSQLPFQVASIIDHQAFVAESVDQAACHFAFATDALLAPEVLTLMSGQNIHAITEVRDGRHLAAKIVQWVET